MPPPLPVTVVTRSETFIFFVYKVICNEPLYLIVTASHGSPKLQVYADNPVQWFHDIRQLLDVVFQISLSNSFRRNAENNQVLPDSTRKFNGKKSCPPQIVARNVERFWNTLMIWWRLARGVSTPETHDPFRLLAIFAHRKYLNQNVVDFAHSFGACHVTDRRVWTPLGWMTFPTETFSV